MKIIMVCLYFLIMKRGLIIFRADNTNNIHESTIMFRLWIYFISGTLLRVCIACPWLSRFFSLPKTKYRISFGAYFMSDKSERFAK